MDDDVLSFAAWDAERTVRFPLVTVRVTEPDVAEPVAVALCTIPSFVVASIPEPSRIVISQPVCVEVPNDAVTVIEPGDDIPAAENNVITRVPFATVCLWVKVYPVADTVGTVDVP